MQRAIRRITLPLLVCTLLFAGPARATIYTFVDENGVMHFSNVPSDPRYVRKLDLYPDRREAERRRSSGVCDGSFPVDPDAYDDLIREAAQRHSVDPPLVKAVIRAESNFDCSAVSPKGALGLMQLMPDTAADMNVAEPFDPQANIEGGTRYLGKMLGLFSGNLRLALAAYNAGPARVMDNNRRVPAISETITYIQRVLAFHKRYQRNFSSGKQWARAEYEPNS